MLRPLLALALLAASLPLALHPAHAQPGAEPWTATLDPAATVLFAGANATWRVGLEGGAEDARLDVWLNESGGAWSLHRGVALAAGARDAVLFSAPANATGNVTVRASAADEAGRAWAAEAALRVVARGEEDARLVPGLGATVPPGPHAFAADEPPVVTLALHNLDDAPVHVRHVLRRADGTAFVEGPLVLLPPGGPTPYEVEATVDFALLREPWRSDVWRQSHVLEVAVEGAPSLTLRFPLETSFETSPTPLAFAPADKAAMLLSPDMEGPVTVPQGGTARTMLLMVNGWEGPVDVLVPRRGLAQEGVEFASTLLEAEGKPARVRVPAGEGFELPIRVYASADAPLGTHHMRLLVDTQVPEGEGGLWVPIEVRVVPASTPTALASHGRALVEDHPGATAGLVASGAALMGAVVLRAEPRRVALATALAPLYTRIARSRVA